MTPPALSPETLEASAIEALNNRCFCISLSEQALRAALESEIGQPGLLELIRERCPYLFAALPVFVSEDHLTRMGNLIQAIESVIALPAYREQILATAPAIARHDPGGARGAFFGYDHRNKEWE